MKKTFFICISLILGLSSCKKENPYVSKDVIDAIRAKKNPVISNVCCVYNNDIYFFDKLSSTPQRITNSPSVVKQSIKMSYNLQKFAYQTSNGAIEIVDKTGVVLATLTQYSYPESFDWSADNATLYILKNSILYFYGPAMNIPVITYPSSIPFGSSKDIVDLSISSNGDLAYIIHYYNFSQGHMEMLVRKWNNNSNTEVVYESYLSGYPLCYVKYSINGQDLVAGHGQNQNLYALEVFKGHSEYPEFEWNSTESHLSPVYRSDINCLVEGYMSSNDNLYVLTGFNLYYPEYNLLYPYYNGNNYSFSVDWK